MYQISNPRPLRFCDKNPALLYSTGEEEHMADYLKMCGPTTQTPCPPPCSTDQYHSHPSTFYLIELAPQPVLFRDVLDELIKFTDTQLKVCNCSLVFITLFDKYILCSRG